jgi:addiction module HigA family antidote
MSGRIVNEYNPLDVTLPGATLEEALEERAMSQAELAERTGRPRKTINEIVRGQAAITPETAIQLERVLGIPASFWNARQRQYDEARAREQSRQRLERAGDWSVLFPVSQMAKLGWLPDVRTRVERAEVLLRFFGIGSPNEWDRLYGATRLQTAFRDSRSFRSNLWALSAWIRQGELQARAMKCAPFERRTFSDALRRVRSLIGGPQEGFDSTIVGACAAAGVAVVFVPLVKGVHASGATRWLTGERAMLLLSLRGKREDIFWFSFFHEAAHILLHGKRGLFIESASRDDSEAERDADAFAAEYLIPPTRWKEFVSRNERATEENVLDFARSVDVSPGMVVGRLQHEGRIGHSQMNSLRRTIEFASSRPG